MNLKLSVATKINKFAPEIQTKQKVPLPILGVFMDNKFHYRLFTVHNIYKRNDLLLIF